MTSERISRFIPIKGTPDTAPSEDHLVLSQCPSFICQNIFNLPQVFTNCCAENYCVKVDLAEEKKEQLHVSLSIEIRMVAYFAAWAGMSFSRSYISSSQSMNFAYRLLTKSKETYKTHKSSLEHHWQVSNRSNFSFGMTVRESISTVQCFPLALWHCLLLEKTITQLHTEGNYKMENMHCIQKVQFTELC